MRIIFSGGGTLGPVMPLIAIYQELKKNRPDWEFLWVGTKDGPEERLVGSYGLNFKKILAVKLRRYMSWKNVADFFIFWAAFAQSVQLMKLWQPDILITAGGYISVPLHLAAWFFKKVTIVHQQDVRVGLANRLMSFFATYVTTSLEINVKDFPKNKTIRMGNPVRAGVLRGSREAAIAHFSLDPDLPTILILGGGTGALSLNKLVARSLGEVIDRCQVIHMTGPGKAVAVPKFLGNTRDRLLAERYHPMVFLDEDLLSHALAAADLVVCRAGFSTLSELSVLGKAILIVPIANSHQEDNAIYFNHRAEAPIFNEGSQNKDEFVREIKRLLGDLGELKVMGHNMSKIIPKDAREKYAFLIDEIAAKLSSQS
ncbi:MAG: UDP-N-acetylglucosamine--N-acetylmuramyl-(pentapeptide) pyrophosphoryl-undecaprenol N-acetylglucosamine transferase [Patescibacteria group bacterium]